MLYVKKHSDDVELKIDLYEDEIFSSCPACGKEHEVQPEELADIIQTGADFSGTSIYCYGCFGDAS